MHPGAIPQGSNSTRRPTPSVGHVCWRMTTSVVHLGTRMKDGKAPVKLVSGAFREHVGSSHLLCATLVTPSVREKQNFKKDCQIQNFVGPRSLWGARKWTWGSREVVPIYREDIGKVDYHSLPCWKLIPTTSWVDDFYRRKFSGPRLFFF
jgi:hypothetical protein